MAFSHFKFAVLTIILFCAIWDLSFATPYDGPIYDSSAYTKCKEYPEEALYEGGMLKEKGDEIREEGYTNFAALSLHHLSPAFYSFSTWITIEGRDTTHIRASLRGEEETYKCIGTIIAKHGCWSFLKGGFVLNSPSPLSTLYLENLGNESIKLSLASASLQPFTSEQWRINQDYKIHQERKRFVEIHVSNKEGQRLEGAQVRVHQISTDFLFGSAIASTIIGNLPYQRWLLKRFNAVVFENELKWYATEPEPGRTNYTDADKMMEFVRANQIIARGHNIFWEDPKYTPSWVLNLTGPELRCAVDSRIRALMSRYRGDFIHWDVSNEMLHFDFYEERLGPNATLRFFKTAHEVDPLATLFMNEFNVVETCSDEKSTVDEYIERLRELKNGGVIMNGIGLEGHFDVPNPPLIRATLDKLGTLALPIWFTEVDISHSLDKQAQALYLEQVLREGFSHPSVKGIMLWTALHPKGCYQMCLTDYNLHNLPAGDSVDKLLNEWQTDKGEGHTDELGSFSFNGYLGEYRVVINYGNRSANGTFSLSRGEETRHFNIQV